jgi:hypothetical protein
MTIGFPEFDNFLKFFCLECCSYTYYYYLFYDSGLN